jgi:GNAT superfamily N-acetyltransferase
MPDELAAWWAAAPGAPGVHCFVAYDGPEPAAAALLFVAGRTGWLGAAGTRPRFRRRGGQGAVLAARIRAAAELGLEALATETGERLPDRPSNSYRNILRFGFEEAYLRPNLVSPPPR